MIEGGEILRAVMTSNTKTRKQKYYTTPIFMAANTPVGRRVSGQLQFEKNAYFLTTGVIVTCMRDGLQANTRIHREAIAKIDFSFPSNNKLMQRDMQLAVSVYSDRINNMSDFEEYVMFEGNELVTVGITSIVLVSNATYYVTLCGIEYRN